MHRIIAAAFIAALLAACGAAPSAPTLTTPVPTDTQAPARTATVTETSVPSPTVAPTETSTPTSSPVPSTDFENERWGISFPYPADWQVVMAGAEKLVRYEGSNGFFAVRGPFEGDTCDMLQACYLASEDPANDCRTYGPGVLEGQSTLYIPLPGGIAGREEWVTLETDPAHADLVLQAVKIDSQARADIWKTPAPVWYDWVANTFGELTVNEFFLDAIDEGETGGLCAMTYDGYVNPDDLSIHETLRAELPFSGAGPLESARELLPLHGYILEGPADGPYTLKQGEQVVLENIQKVVAYTESARQKDFALVLDTGSPKRWLVRKNSLEEKYLYLDPVFVGQHLMTAELEPGQPWQQLKILQDGVGVFTAFEPQSKANALFDHIAKGETFQLRLHSYAEQWMLELPGTLIVNGQNWNETLSADEIYGFRFLYGKPFFFFNRGGMTGIWYDGVELPVQYDVIAHDHLQQPLATSPQGNDLMVWFFARRDSGWFYVEIVYGEE